MATDNAEADGGLATHPANQSFRRSLDWCSSTNHLETPHCRVGRSSSRVKRLRLRRTAQGLWNPINYAPRDLPAPSSRRSATSGESLIHSPSRDPYTSRPHARPAQASKPRRTRTRPVDDRGDEFVSAAETSSGRAGLLPPSPTAMGDWGDERSRAKLDRMLGRGDAGNPFKAVPPKPKPAHVTHVDMDGHGKVEATDFGNPEFNATVVDESRNSFNPDGAPSFLSSSSSIAGDPDAPVEEADEYAWGPSHPCFPHQNPHVPIDSPLYTSTRVIRIKRDWMIAGDEAPTFSNLYPEILDPVLPEDQFRTVVRRLNEELTIAFNPHGWRNVVDAVLGMLTFWIWDDIGATAVKRRLADLEAWLDRWNREIGEKEGVKILPLRRTGYMTLDIQIPDPQIGTAGASEAESRPPTDPVVNGLSQNTPVNSGPPLVRTIDYERPTAR
ncbi:MAG: hypothetical protein M1838_006240 [Thelocarpon superellum]|nr:MAG: hypothetical protein M1838_006240 [Thelocarpon superellum]